ncbi:MAG: 50S ribosomal protein L24 [Acidobacteria bacterium]|nr:50S ribosomal protein L24 [Acidobacteriota bacterium]MCG3192479.1 50S ribosomal protein L24 [Thermoanaerobaculia bacterium]MCK6683312.1 50S ribosomal protein L24 [Thermoanaerobaculia bacterium]
MRKKKAEYTGKFRIRKGDEVIVISGKDQGASGKVLRCLPSKGRVIVEGVNMIKRATRPNPQKNIKGGILEREAPIAVSNVMIKDPGTGKATRIGVRVEGQERVRFARKSKSTIASGAER